MFSPSRDQAREFWFAAWAKFQAQAQLTALEKLAVEIAVRHPEYHAMLARTDANVARDFPVETGVTNPYLHLSMHMAIAEQISIDQPRGITAIYATLCAQHGDEHAAQHEIMECLAEMIWHAQRHKTAPNPAILFACLAKKTANETGNEIENTAGQTQ